MTIEGLYDELMEKYSYNGRRVSDVYLDLDNGQIIAGLDKQVYQHYVDDKLRGYYGENKRLCQEIMDYVDEEYPDEFLMDFSDECPILSIEPCPSHMMMESRIRWIPVNEGFMDGIKSMWKKVKDAFSDLPVAQLNGKNGKKVEGYVHEYNKRKNTCELWVEEVFEESVATIAAAAASANAMRHNRDMMRSHGKDERKPNRTPQEFKPGDKATLVGSQIGDSVDVVVEGYEQFNDFGIYYLKIEG